MISLRQHDTRFQDVVAMDDDEREDDDGILPRLFEIDYAGGVVAGTKGVDTLGIGGYPVREEMGVSRGWMQRVPGEEAVYAASFLRTLLAPACAWVQRGPLHQAAYVLPSHVSITLSRSTQLSSNLLLLLLHETLSALSTSIDRATN